MKLLFVLSPLVTLALGALGLMLVDAFAQPRDEARRRSPELGLGTAVVLVVAAISSLAVWLVDPAGSREAARLAPYLVIDRYSLFFCLVLGLGGALVALLAEGY